MSGILSTAFNRDPIRFVRVLYVALYGPLVVVAVGFLVWWLVA